MRQPRLNRQVAEAYLARADSRANTRTWQAIDIIITHKRGANRRAKCTKGMLTRRPLDLRLEIACPTQNDSTDLRKFSKDSLNNGV